MPVASIASPISPPSASISRTRCPFAVPPTAGLQGMCATVAPGKRAEADPASHPRRGAGGLHSGVSRPDHDDIESIAHFGSSLVTFRCRTARRSVRGPHPAPAFREISSNARRASSRSARTSSSDAPASAAAEARPSAASAAPRQADVTNVRNGRRVPGRRLALQNTQEGVSNRAGRAPVNQARLHHVRAAGGCLREFRRTPCGRQVALVGDHEARTRRRRPEQGAIVLIQRPATGRER